MQEFSAALQDVCNCNFEVSVNTTHWENEAEIAPPQKKEMERPVLGRELRNTGLTNIVNSSTTTIIIIIIIIR
jgi:hypothetical protein